MFTAWSLEFFLKLEIMQPEIHTPGGIHGSAGQRGKKKTTQNQPIKKPSDSETDEI